LNDWRRVATRYDKLARNFRATVAVACMIIWWA
jgi:putative transposase